MNIHHKCPACDERGDQVQGQEGNTVMCRNEGCRVYTFATYYG